MVTNKKEENLWASGFLKIIIEQWEGNGGFMNSDEFYQFIKKNIEKIASFVSSADSKERLMLTLVKLSAVRKIPKEIFKEILDCFVKRKLITEADGLKFLNIYL